jgi:hypothetical protein
MAVAALVAALTLGGPVFMSSGTAAQAQNRLCACFASFDAIDSDNQYVGWYYNSAIVDMSIEPCWQACDTWRRNWFYWNACDVPTRINRGRNAWSGYDDGLGDTYIGPDTWWCPFPPP